MRSTTTVALTPRGRAKLPAYKDVREVPRRFFGYLPDLLRRLDVRAAACCEPIDKIGKDELKENGQTSFKEEGIPSWQPQQLSALLTIANSNNRINRLLYHLEQSNLDKEDI